MNRMTRRFVKGMGVLVCAVVVSCSLLTSVAFAVGELNANTVTTKTGNRQITVAWRSVEGAERYSVWRSLGTSGEGATCVDIVLAKEGTTFVDQTAAPGTTYYYAVRATNPGDQTQAQSSKGLSWKGPVKLNVTWDGVYSPHLGMRFTAQHENGCRTCHEVVTSTDGGTAASLLNAPAQKTDSATVTEKCIVCHMESKAPAQQSVGALFSKEGSGHSVATSSDPNGKLSCATCHNPHADSSTNTYLVPETITLGTVKKKVEAGNNGLCLTCHDSSATWYTQTTGNAYPKTSDPVRETKAVNGYYDYPVLGTFTSPDAYAKSGHSTIMASGNLETGDCQYCHAAHKSEAPYDGLLTQNRGEYRAMRALDDGSNVVDPTERLSGDYAGLCLSCHGDDRNELDPATQASSESTTTNIRALVVPDASDAATSNAGHRIDSANATVPQNSNMPCYYCHNPHGSNRGNVANISDERGQNITKADLERNICFTCHSSAEGTVFDTVSRAWIPATDSMKVVGLSMTGLDKTILHPEGVPNKLKLAAIANEAHSQNSTVACSTCHGDIHDPQVKEEKNDAQAPVVTGLFVRGDDSSNTVVDNAVFFDSDDVKSLGIEYATAEDFSTTTPLYATLDDLSKVTLRLDGGSYFDIALRDLQPNTTYYYRAVCEKSDGEILAGEIKSFSTPWF